MFYILSDESNIQITPPRYVRIPIDWHCDPAAPVLAPTVYTDADCETPKGAGDVTSSLSTGPCATGVKFTCTKCFDSSTCATMTPAPMSFKMDAKTYSDSGCNSETASDTKLYMTGACVATDTANVFLKIPDTYFFVLTDLRSILLLSRWISFYAQCLVESTDGFI